MKIWFGYGSEHSANLVIIGEFKGADDAQSSLDLLNRAVEVARSDEKAGRLNAGAVASKFTDAQMDLFRATELSLNYGDPEQLLLDFDARREGKKVVITTEEQDINAFMKVLLHGGAKVEVYSAHAHGGPYGRRTKTA
ncbi:MAG: DUF6375 family protein [Bradyrhizobium sp.]|uniref:DUF6375 family protein n=1 Tax=Bradyrhizobium sp. TaxID=376 RepID=UPI0029B70C50|nr:DUF6375 family protein [Bradyrhizobium sp.]MDX3967702.1 DUF6375 family protein [Bradyrhizobium sp.]